MEATTKASEAMDSASPETAIQCTFNPDNMLKRVLLPKCVEAGIPDVQSRISLAEMKDVVRKFFLELHGSESATLHKLDCCTVKTQLIKRKKKQTIA
jgi:hypothetical protein